VYVDANDNGIRDEGEAPIPGTTVTLYRPTQTAGILDPVATTTTNANGAYQFTNLAPGIYYVIENQPNGFVDGKDTLGSAGGIVLGNDFLGAVPVTAGQDSPNNNFGEKQPCFTLFGYVWFDQNQNGLFDPGERGLGGVPVTISGTTASGQTLTTALTGGEALTMITDTNGRYAYSCLPAGTYTLNQTSTPAGYVDFRSQNASGLTVGSSTPTSFTAIGLDRNAPGPLNFGKVIPGSTVQEPGRPNPLTPGGTNSKQDFLGSSRGGATSPVSPANPLLTAPTVSLPLNAAPTGGAGTLVGSAGAGYLPVVRVFDTATGAEKFRVMAFEEQFLGGVDTAVGDVNGDGVDDVICAAGATGGPRVRVFDGATGIAIRDFFAYDPSFRGGVWVASGDFNGDGIDDIVTGAGDGGGAHVRVIDGRTNGTGIIKEFFAFDPAIRAGARVAVGDFNGDGRADIAAGTGAGTASQVALFDGSTLAVLNRFAPFESVFTGGVSLAAGDVNGDGRAEVIVSAANNGGPRVRVLNATTGATVYDFFAADPTFGGGVRVAAKDVNGDGKADIITGGGVGGFSRVQVYSGVNLSRLEDFYLFDSGVKTGVYVG
jgi:hypothetical protein